LRLYTYSDRIRYYWHRPEIAAAVARLIRTFLGGYPGGATQ
jgi:tagatose-1,6-bisphosphate aldolase non-catalytic subunit AgaZ/GatZ